MGYTDTGTVTMIHKIRIASCHKGIQTFWMLSTNICLCACWLGSSLTNHLPQPVRQVTPHTSPPSTSPSTIKLECPNPHQELNPGEVRILPLTLFFDDTLSSNFHVLLETRTGANWYTAFCYEDFCFMHDGESPLQKEISLNSPAQLEIKFFPPANAATGETKTVHLSLQSNSGAAVDIDLTGYIP